MVVFDENEDFANHPEAARSRSASRTNTLPPKRKILKKYKENIYSAPQEWYYKNQKEVNNGK